MKNPSLFLILALALALAFVACAPSSNFKVRGYPDPACPDGYTWTIRAGDVPDHDRGACLNNAWKLTNECVSFRDPSGFPTYAYWSCGGNPYELNIKPDAVAEKIPGSFIPGEKAVICMLYDEDGRFLEGVQIQDGTQRYPSPERALFVKCRDFLDAPIYPKATTGPLCPFLGDTPKCPDIPPDTEVRQTR